MTFHLSNKPDHLLVNRLESGTSVRHREVGTGAISLIHLLDIYFHQRNADEHHAALELRDAVLRLRRDGAFVAVPLFRVNTDPIGPHPVGGCYVSR